MPDFVSRSKRSKDFFSAVHGHELAHSLLDIALGLVEGDSGSVLFLDENEKYFYIKTARGIPADIVETARIPYRKGVVGWVAGRGKPTLVQKEVTDSVLKKRLRRPEIRSSIVIPMAFQSRILGIFCVNAKSENKQFNQNNLLLLDQLGKLASIAFARMGVY
jgi:GAF domain-containing protein